MVVDDCSLDRFRNNDFRVRNRFDIQRDHEIAFFQESYRESWSFVFVNIHPHTSMYTYTLIIATMAHDGDWSLLKEIVSKHLSDCFNNFDQFFNHIIVCYFFIRRMHFTLLQEAWFCFYWFMKLNWNYCKSVSHLLANQFHTISKVLINCVCLIRTRFMQPESFVRVRMDQLITSPRYFPLYLCYCHVKKKKKKSNCDIHTLEC